MPGIVDKHGHRLQKFIHGGRDEHQCINCNLVVDALDDAAGVDCEPRLVTDGGSAPLDGWPCPLIGCPGSLEQQDEYNVMCVADDCGESWSIESTDDGRNLRNEDEDLVHSYLLRKDGDDLLGLPPLPDNHAERWWECPDCGADTETRTVENPPAGRECTECDWSVTIPTYPMGRERWMKRKISGGDFYVPLREDDGERYEKLERTALAATLKPRIVENSELVAAALRLAATEYERAQDVDLPGGVTDGEIETLHELASDVEEVADR